MNMLWFIVMVELTNGCNFHCSFCPIDASKRSKRQMPRKLWHKVLTELGREKLCSTVFFHLLGEPLLHREVFEAIAYANSLDLSVSLYTNAALLDSTRAVSLLQSLKKGRVVISLQDVDPLSFKERSRNRIPWEQYQEQIQAFVEMAARQEYGIPVQIHCMVDILGLGWNVIGILREQNRVRRYYESWFKDGRHPRINIFNPGGVYPLPDGNATLYIKHKGTWDNMYIPDTMEVVPRDTGYCQLMTDTFAVLSNGVCTYCCCDYEGVLNLGNANDQTLREIYFGAKATRIREEGRRGKMVENRCRVCRGTLVYRKDGKAVPSRNLITEFYLFKDHLRQYGTAATIRKIGENLRRRFRTS